MSDTSNESCTVCSEKVNYCTCSRCELCATIFAEHSADEHMDWDTGLCRDCSTED